jgi:transcriptional regulator with XRE-family HTH domain
MMRTMPVRDRTLLGFGQNVARLRVARGLSQDQLAEQADLDRTYVSGIERGLRNPGIKAVLRIARALGASPGDLCRGVEP